MRPLQKHFLWRIAALRKFIIVSLRNLPVHHVLSRFLRSVTTELMLQHLVKLGTPLAGVRLWRTNNAL